MTDAPALRTARMRGVARAVGSFLGMPLRHEGAIVFAYHDVGDPRSNTTRYLVSPEDLEAQLRRSITSGLRFVTVDEIVRRLHGGDSLDGLAAVTFDDSLRGVYDHASHVLHALDIPATVFTVAGALGEPPSWWQGAAPVMTAAQLAELDRSGIRIESHTMTHASLPTLSRAQIREELRSSRCRLEDVLQREVELLAYPYGHFDKRVIEEARAAGYRAGFTFLNGRTTTDVDIFRIPRLNMWAGQRAIRLRYHLARSAQSWPEHQLDRVSGPPGDAESQRLP